MSYAVDANVLLYASDQTSAFHKRALEFLHSCSVHPELWYVAWPTFMAYLRISTHPRIFAQPLSAQEDLGNIRALLQVPHVRPLAEVDGFLEVYEEITGNFPVRGNLVPDAHLVALLRQHDVRKLYTADRDFRKFDFLDVQNPFA
ncbi:MAG: PIN domain-containing protein [Nitrospirae bacterium]|nr:PIN domain-containing protein [Nitrospirota bacterium]MDA1304153.1 PIN domain-containing protein [Nitrospirota bacterium]